MKKARFQKIIRGNEKEVKTWASWKQKIVISAINAQTGRYYETT